MSSYGYATALKAAGAEVIEFTSFGSYQGKWMALVDYNGERGIVTGYYGSCSGCDAYEAEFGYESHTVEDHGGQETWHYPTGREDGFVAGCEQCETFKVALSNFGQKYLVDITPVEEYKTFLEDCTADWQSDEREMLEVLKSWIN
jgi:hypothetical protein